MCSPMEPSNKQERKYAAKMAKVAFWGVQVILVALFVGYCRDSNVPEEIPETWRIRLIDAAHRTYNHVVGHSLVSHDLMNNL